MATDKEIKEAYKMFYMMKGHINVTDKTALESYDGYFRRAWGNHEWVYHEDGFEKAWQQKVLNELTEETKELDCCRDCVEYGSHFCDDCLKEIKSKTNK